MFCSKLNKLLGLVCGSSELLGGEWCALEKASRVEDLNIPDLYRPPARHS